MEDGAAGTLSSVSIREQLDGRTDLVGEADGRQNLLVLDGEPDAVLLEKIVDGLRIKQRTRLVLFGRLVDRGLRRQRYRHGDAQAGDTRAAEQECERVKPNC